MQSAALCKKSRSPRPKKSNGDRLSDLSDDILHRVFFFMDFLDVVRTCVLSKRWQYVWGSVPHLNFDMDWFIRFNCRTGYDLLDRNRRFWDFVKWSLLLRDGSQIVRISLCSDNKISYQLNGLLRVVGRLKVREICFLGGDYAYELLDFPRGACETLTDLTLHFRDAITLRFAAVFSSLRSLSLRGVRISRDAAHKLLSGGCVKLEDVYLEDCQIINIEQIDISAGNLKNLTIVNACTCDKFWVVASFDSKLRISAPNLLSFCYIGPMLRGFTLVDTVSLKNVTIRLLRVPLRYGVGYKNHLLSAERFVGLNTAKTLTLSTLVVKYFSPMFCYSWDAFILDNVSRLELELRYKASFIEGMINLLRFSPNIVTLVIRFKEGQMPQRKSRKVTVKRGFWKSRLENFACLMYNVKFIQVSNVDGSAIAFELVKFLLKNGKALQKMEIMHKSGEKKRKNFSKLKALPKASSEVVITFPECAQKTIPWFDKGDSDPEFDD